MLQDKSEIGDVSSLLTFDLNLLQPQPPCSDLCPLLNDQKPKVIRAEVGEPKPFALTTELFVDGPYEYKDRFSQFIVIYRISNLPLSDYQFECAITELQETRGS